MALFEAPSDRIAAFFVAHLGYLDYSLKAGKMQWTALWWLLIGYLAYFILLLYPAIDETVLSVAVLAYLLVSCFVLAAALGIQQGGLAKWGYVMGMALIVGSDTLISVGEFLHYRKFNWLILPTYYLAHLVISLALMSRADRRRSFHDQ